MKGTSGLAKTKHLPPKQNLVFENSRAVKKEIEFTSFKIEKKKKGIE